MRKSMMAIMLASTISLSACATTDSRYAGDVAQGAAVGAAGGAAIGAVVPGVNVIEGAAIGAVVGGLSGAVWADNNGDGYADGYVQNGTYYAGTPQGYDPTLRRVATGALGGAALGAAAGAVIGGLSPIEGAVIGAAIGGLAGAVWADNDRDGRADGYVYNGQYYQGAPQGQSMPASTRTGERG
ncbi:MAG TPA: glycine zipper domain-containing protein [Sphingomicrobium sp.]|nr:glycine zipper domain-containing protein [Sphingomicrobium sp.]